MCDGGRASNRFHGGAWSSSSTDPHLNLAAEELALDHADPSVPMLFVYENEEAVVIGKHQNPWLECDPKRVRRAGVPLIRRISGGGCVYHGRGNLNISFVWPRERFERSRGPQLIAQALADLGVHGNVTERGDILVDGRKVSGNALCYRKQAVLHHATLLVEADLARLSTMLEPRVEAAVETHAVRSQRMPVANVAQWNPGLSVSRVRGAVGRRFLQVFGGRWKSIFEVLSPDEVWRRSEERRNWEWTYGKTPRFYFTAPDGCRVTVVSGRVQDDRNGTRQESAVSRSTTEKATDKQSSSTLFDPDRFVESVRNCSLEKELLDG